MPYPIVTIAMPVKNRAWALPYVLKSIESQDYPKKLIKVVFVDNYSTDETYNILNKWVAEKGRQYYKVVLVREKGNIAHLRNKCLELAEGKYILFWDSDIVAPKFAIRRMVEIAELKNAGIVVATFKYADLDYVSKIMSLEDTIPEVAVVKGAGTGFTLVRLDVAIRVGRFNEKLSVGEDTEFSIKIAEKTKYPILRASIEVLHLKHRDTLIPRASQNMRLWLKYNFYLRSEEYLASFSSLPHRLKLRIVYWFLLPLITLFTSMTLIMLRANHLSKMLIIALFILYISLSIYPLVREQGIIGGLRTWISFNLPTGISLSYGVVFKIFKRLVKAIIRVH
jgi:glycosyltransferase involved in cell wall biosynthesis